MLLCPRFNYAKTITQKTRNLLLSIRQFVVSCCKSISLFALKYPDIANIDVVQLVLFGGIFLWYTHAHVYLFFTLRSVYCILLEKEDTFEYPEYVRVDPEFPTFAYTYIYGDSYEYTSLRSLLVRFLRRQLDVSITRANFGWMYLLLYCWGAYLLRKTYKRVRARLRTGFRRSAAMRRRLEFEREVAARLFELRHNRYGYCYPNRFYDNGRKNPVYSPRPPWEVGHLKSSFKV